MVEIFCSWREKSKVLGAYLAFLAGVGTDVAGPASAAVEGGAVAGAAVVTAGQAVALAAEF